jgi:hypothetical protein
MRLFAGGIRGTRPGRPAAMPLSGRDVPAPDGDGAGDAWVRPDGSYELTLTFVKQVVGVLCTGLRSIAGGDLKDAGDAFSEAARCIDRACCKAERYRHLTPVTSARQVRDLVLGYIPALLQALELQASGRRDEAVETLAGIPGALWKAAGFLYQEASHQYHPGPRHADAFFDCHGTQNRTALQEALGALLENDRLERVVCTAVGAGRQVWFGKAADGALTLCVSLAGLDDIARRRADVFFANMAGEKGPEEVRVLLGRDAVAGARVAFGVFEVIYGVESGCDLTVEVS